MATRTSGMTSCALRGVRVGYLSLSRIASPGMLCRKTLVGEHWIENDLYNYWELGVPAV